MQAIYHGTNSFAKENYRESLALVTSQILGINNFSVALCRTSFFPKVNQP
jgi:hypothetical protein